MTEKDLATISTLKRHVSLFPFSSKREATVPILTVAIILVVDAWVFGVDRMVSSRGFDVSVRVRPSERNVLHRQANMCMAAVIALFHFPFEMCGWASERFCLLVVVVRGVDEN